MSKTREKYHEIDNLVKATKKVLEVTGNNKEDYHTFRIPKKSGGFRTINAPAEGLMEFQRLRLQQLYMKTTRPYFAHGFERGRNIYTNARIHCGKKYILNIDIKDFFPSCTVQHASHSTSFDMEPWEYAKDGVLPQGAPTSPAIANRIMASVDNRIVFKVKKWITDDVRYTRYADDITLSSNSRAIFGKATYEIIKEALATKGFKINKKKVRRTSAGRRLEVTGLAINSGKPTVPRKFRRNIRAAVHNAFHNGVTSSNKGTLEGKIGHIALCHPKEAKKLLTKLSKASVSKTIDKNKKDSAANDSAANDSAANDSVNNVDTSNAFTFNPFALNP